MNILSVTYASSPSSDLLISTLEFNNETAGVIRLHVAQTGPLYSYVASLTAIAHVMVG